MARPGWGQVIGLPVTVGDMPSVCQEILRLARRGAGGQVCVANVHMLVEARRDGALRDVLERAALVVSDGMPLVWRLRRQGFAQARQVRKPIPLRPSATRRASWFFGADPVDTTASEPARLRSAKPCNCTWSRPRRANSTARV